VHSPSISRTLLLALMLGLGLVAGGCASATAGASWTVKPHQREMLADKIMNLDGDPQERSADQHMLANREGAIGGSGTSGGGCGCN
jgi:hypothetical protein